MPRLMQMYRLSFQLLGSNLVAQADYNLGEPKPASLPMISKSIGYVPRPANINNLAFIDQLVDATKFLPVKPHGILLASAGMLLNHKEVINYHALVRSRFVPAAKCRIDKPSRTCYDPPNKSAIPPHLIRA